MKKILLMIAITAIYSCKNPLINNTSYVGCFDNCISKPNETTSPEFSISGATDQYSFAINRLAASRGYSLILNNPSNATINSCSALQTGGTLTNSDYTLTATNTGTTCNVTFEPTETDIGSLNYSITISSSIGSATLNGSITIVDPAVNITSALIDRDVRKDNVLTTTSLVTDQPLTNCTVSPALPSGLTLGMSGNQCNITGTPNVISNPTDYTVTAESYSQSITDTVNIGVYAAPCTLTSYNTGSTARSSSDLSQRVICTNQQLLNISANFGANYILGSNLDLTAEPITLSYIVDAGNVGFNGVLDGNGHTITGIRMPLFRSVDGIVRNLTFANSVIDSANAGIVARNLRSTSLVRDILINGSSTNLDDTGTGFPDKNGAIAGVDVSGAQMINIYVKEVLSPGSAVKCLTGTTTNATVSNSYFLNTSAFCTPHDGTTPLSESSGTTVNITGGNWTNTGVDPVLTPADLKVYSNGSI